MEVCVRSLVVKVVDVEVQRYSFSLFPASHRFLVSFSTKTWISDAGERKDFEVYSCDVSLDGSRLVSAAGGEWILIAGSSWLSSFPLLFSVFAPPLHFRFILRARRMRRQFLTQRF